MRLRPLSTVLLAIPALALIVLVALRLVRFVEIFGAHAGTALTQEEVESAYNTTKGDKTKAEHIPKIIHQVFHNWKDPGNETLPADWDAVRQTCISRNPDFEYRVRPRIESAWPGDHNADGW